MFGEFGPLGIVFDDGTQLLFDKLANAVPDKAVLIGQQLIHQVMVRVLVCVGTHGKFLNLEMRGKFKTFHAQR
jgi:hypothetical protein